MTSETSNEVVEVETRPADTDVDVAETGTRADLLWDDELPGLCVRVYGSGAKSFIFIYRRNDRQRFVRIGMTPTWSLEGARRWAKELRSAVDRGGDPESHKIRQRDMGLFSLRAAVAEMCSYTSRLLSGPGCVRSMRDKPSSTRLRTIAVKSPRPILGSSSGICVFIGRGRCRSLCQRRLSQSKRLHISPRFSQAPA
jgi:Arm DNA-binding domain